MNYFELYGLPISFNPNQQLIQQKFYDLSKKYHPDFYINENAEKQEEVLALSILNNKAFQVLKDPQKRLHYILEISGQLAEGENYTLPQSFLMEMMEVNEALMDLQFDKDEQKLTELTKEVDQIEKTLADELQALTANFDADPSIGYNDLLKSIKDVYYRNKYLWRIKQSLAKL